MADTDSIIPASEAARMRQAAELRECRAGLDKSEIRLADYRARFKPLRLKLRHLQELLASYTSKNKNPFKLFFSRISAPGEMRKERKAIESELESIVEMIETLHKARKSELAETKILLADQPISHATAETRHHVIISGTGRAGTTFLVELLTALGLDTGFQHFSSLINRESNAGLEWDIHRLDAPYIVKNPALCDDLAEVLQSGAVTIDWAILPVREIPAAASSRARVSGKAASPEENVPGGFWDASDLNQQKNVLSQKLSQFVVTLAQHDIPTILLAFPRLVDDASYLYKKLEPLLEGTDFQTFSEIHRNVAQPGLISRELPS